jgi:hypothetical protein
MFYMSIYVPVSDLNIMLLVFSVPLVVGEMKRLSRNMKTKHLR